MAAFILININNGFSGYIELPDLLMALFSINMTLLMQAFWIVFHKDVNYSKYGTNEEDEKKMPFKMSELYVSRNAHISRFLLDYICNTCWGLVCGIFMYFQWYILESNNGIRGSDG